MKQKCAKTKDNEFFLDLLMDQFVLFYALTNVAIASYKSARKNYYAKGHLGSSKRNRQTKAEKS
jgi:hypothetical protein